MSAAAQPSTLLRKSLFCLLALFAIALPAHAQTTWSYSELQSAPASLLYFGGPLLLPASDGNFYAVGRGSSNSTLYSLDALGNLTTVYTFSSYTSAGSPPSIPVGSLLQGPDGYLYGFTSAGGTYGYGAFYKVAIDGSNFTALYNFIGSTDGGTPVGGLTLGTDGNFYALANGSSYTLSAPVRRGPVSLSTPVSKSTTRRTHANAQGHPDGAPTICSSGHAALFQYTPAGQANLIYCDNGDQLTEARQAPVLGADGNFYVMPYGGASLLQIVRTSDSLNAIALSYPSSYTSKGFIVGGADGKIYTTTSLEDESDCGSMMSIDPANTYAVALVGAFDCTDLNLPDTQFYLASDGALYGTAAQNTVNNNGGMYRVDPSGTISYPHDFVSGSGTNPLGAPVQDSVGNFYGITSSTTTFDGAGVSYSLDPTPVIAAPVTLTSSARNIAINTPFTLTWAVNNGSPFDPPVCVALINNATGADGWSRILTGVFTNGVFGGAIEVTPTTAGNLAYQIVCNGQGSASTTVSVQEPLASKTMLAIGPTASMVSGTTATLTASVTRMSDCGSVGRRSPNCAVHSDTPSYPTGTVTFSWNGQQIGQPAILSSGVASLQVNTANLAAQSYNVTAAYSGSDIYGNSGDTESGAIIAIPTTTQLTITDADRTSATAGTIIPGSDAILTAHVTASSGEAIPAGSVTFKSGSVRLGSAVLSNGVATFNVSSAGVPSGSYTMIADYSGNRTHAAGASTGVNVTIAKAVTTTTVSANRSIVGRSQADQLTATVIGSGDAPTGSVHFLWNNYFICSARLSSGSATCSGAAPANAAYGPYSVTAAYMGDHNNNTSTSLPIIVTVAAP